MIDGVIHRDGSRVPDELRDLPPGSCAIASIDDPDPLTDEEEAGIRRETCSRSSGPTIGLAVQSSVTRQR
jgi:hypothetical protein